MQIGTLCFAIREAKNENYHSQLDLQQENIPLKLSA